MNIINSHSFSFFANWGGESTGTRIRDKSKIHLVSGLGDKADRGGVSVDESDGNYVGAKDDIAIGSLKSGWIYRMSAWFRSHPDAPVAGAATANIRFELWITDAAVIRTDSFGFCLSVAVGRYQRWGTPLARRRRRSGRSHRAR